MTAYFDENQDLWIEVDHTNNLPDNLTRTITSYTQHPTHPNLGSYNPTIARAVTYINLTKYISELRLTKILQEVTKES